MRIIPGNAQHIGQRSSQQDAFAFSDIDDQVLTKRLGVLAILADGMGGLAFGKEASQLAVDTVLENYKANIFSGQTIPRALDIAVDAADDAVDALAKRKGEQGNVGTTLVVFVIENSQLHWRSVGDSRLYLWRKPCLVQLTDDHDYGKELDREARDGKISHEYAAGHPERRALTSFIGQGPKQLIDRNQRPLKLRSGDRLLACSDGLYNGLAGQDIARLLDQCSTPHEVAENAVERVLEKQLRGQDNVTVLTVECDEEQPTVIRAARERKPANQPARLFSIFRKKSRRSRV